METNQTNANGEKAPSSESSDFGSMLHAGSLPEDKQAKTMTAEYSLSLIKASLDHLVNENTDGKIPDVDATVAVIKEFGHQDLNKPVGNKYPCSNEMLKELIKDHERIITQLRKNMSNYYERYRDLSFRNILNGIIEEHKTVALTLKRFLIGKTV
ncbi:MAG: Dps family ferritin [Bacteroidetes bacterium]|jgi:hypothetical protein|nr:Dps family ferritin [Bacteroidota bacterium]